MPRVLKTAKRKPRKAEGAAGDSVGLGRPGSAVPGRTIMGKKDYAIARGRTPKQVTMWLKRGIISSSAIIGSGRMAKLWVEQADRDLRDHMDPRFLGEIENMTSVPAPPDAGKKETDSSNLSRKRKAEADQAEMKAEQTRRQMAIEAGDWIQREAAVRAWGRELQELMQNIEVWAASSMPQEIAAELGVDWKTLSAAVRRSFRSFRQDVVDRKKKADVAVSS